MNAIPAQDIKRRGISAVDALLVNGPVHVIRNNRPRYVILSEDDFARLTQTKASPSQKPASIWDWLDRPSLATRSKAEIDADLAEERASWGDR